MYVHIIFSLHSIYTVMYGEKAQKSHSQLGYQEGITNRIFNLGLARFLSTECTLFGTQFVLGFISWDDTKILFGQIR